MSLPSSASPTGRKRRSTRSARASSDHGPRTNFLWRSSGYRLYARHMPVGIVTGASRGLGLVLARELAARGWRLVVDARGESALAQAQGELARTTDVVALTGDVADRAHLDALVEAAGERIDLVVN